MLPVDEMIATQPCLPVTGRVASIKNDGWYKKYLF
jgi:hypothetical protein